MKAKIEYLPFVKNDLEEAFIWYKKINPKLANRFIQDYKTQIKHISEFPLSCEQKLNSIRISFLNSFPFGIHYKYKKTENIVVVYAVFHTSKNPELFETETKITS